VLRQAPDPARSAGPGPDGLRGKLHITWRTNVQRAVATVTGTVGGVVVRATTPAL
jgi:hypothetical protein